MSSVAGHAPAGFDHEAFFYGSDVQYADALAPLLADALGAGQETFAAVPPRNAALLRAALGYDGRAVRWIDAGDWYGQPVRTIAGYDALLRRLAPGRAAFVIGEVRFGASADDWLRWTRYEAALNRVFERYPARVICPYDERSLPPSVVADAERTHPHLLRPDRSSHPSTRYRQPEDLLRTLTAPVVVPDARPRLTMDDVHSARAGRRAFAQVALECGVPEVRVKELTVAVSEVLTNAIVHGAGTSSLRVWTLDDEVVCLVEDAGNGTDDPLLGMRPPRPDAPSGYGLWYARQVFDRTEVVRSPLGGLLVRLAADLT